MARRAVRHVERSTPLDDELEASSLRDDPEYRNSYFVVPREELGDEAPGSETTYSAAAAIRSSRENPLLLVPPRKSPSSVFTRLGLINVEKVAGGIPPARQLSSYGRGIFAPQPAMGMASAYFLHEDAEREAKAELEEEFEFVPNFPIRIPSRVRLEDVPATRGMTALTASEWPEVSGVALAHKNGIRGAGVLAGVIDTGIDADHIEFSHLSSIPFRYVPLFPKDVPPRDIRGFDTQGHGTHVCGILAGKSVGVAPEVNLSVAAVIESETTRTSMVRVTYGLEWIMQQFSRLHVDQFPAVLNMSLGFTQTASNMTEQEFNQRLLLLRTLLRTLIRANVLPVVALGNEGPRTSRFPGALEEVVGIGAVDFAGQLADFSSWAAKKPDVVGYGVGVYSSTERDYNGRSVYQRFSGTSMATPYVTGIAALYRCAYPSATVEQIRTMIFGNAINLKQGGTGHGLACFK